MLSRLRLAKNLVITKLVKSTLHALLCRQPNWQQPVRNTWRGDTDFPPLEAAASPPASAVASTQKDADSSQNSQTDKRERSRSPVRQIELRKVPDQHEQFPTDVKECLKAGWEIQDAAALAIVSIEVLLQLSTGSNMAKG